MIDYVALGSVVLLKGGTQKIVVIARGLNVKNGEKVFFFDYGGVPYPNGLTGDQIAYFNQDSISRVVFEGYRDVDDENVVENINRYLEGNPDVERGNPSTWKA